MNETQEAEAHWSKTRGLMIYCLVVGSMLGIGIHFFAGALNAVTVFGIPVGYLLASQGALIGFVGLVFWFCGRQDAIDREFGVAEE